MAYPKVTVVGAGHVGATTAFLLALHDVADVVLTDVADGLAAGKALDMMHARSVEHFGPVVRGVQGYDGTEGSDVVVVTAGVPRKPGMTREELLAINAGIVRSIIPAAVEKSPDAVFICVTNPLDIMTDLAWRISGLPAERVMGMGGVLDSARFAYAIAEMTGAPIDEVFAVVVGAHGETMVPLPSRSTVSGRPLMEVVPADGIDELVRRTVGGGAEVVGLLKTGSAYHAPAASVVRMVRAILDDAGEVMPACVRLEGQYGIAGVYVTVEAALGRDGVVAIPEPLLRDTEVFALMDSARGIAEAVEALGGS